MMTLSQDEARQALKDIDAASGRMRTLRLYSNMTPFFVLWGVVWFSCDLITQLAPRLIWTWAIGDVVGFGGSILIQIILSRRVGRSEHSRRYLLKVQLSMLVVMAFVAGVYAITWPIDWKQSHAFWGVFVGCIYAFMGIWLGMRLFIVGALLAALSLAAYFWIGPYYLLFMGVVGGGSLILGGLWLGRA